MSALDDVKGVIAKHMTEDAISAVGSDRSNPFQSFRTTKRVSSATWTRMMDKFGVKETRALSKSAGFVNRPPFQIFIAGCIFASSLNIGIETDLRKGSLKNHWAWVFLDHFFCSAWVFEFLAKTCADGPSYFCDAWNLMDVFLMMLSVMETWLLPIFQLEASKLNVLSLLRILRIIRLVRLVKLMRMFKMLWLILTGFYNALRTLVWVLLLLCVVMYAGGIYLTIIVGHRCDTEFPRWADCGDYFGTVPQTMFTLFQVMTLDTWSSAIGREIFTVKPSVFIFFLLYLLVTTFGLLNIVVGVVVENTMEASSQDKLLREIEAQKAARTELLSLRSLFLAADRDHSGLVDEAEFTSILKHKSFQQKLMELQIDLPPYPDLLFDDIDRDDNGTINLEEFIDGIVDLKGPPTTQEEHTASMRLRHLEEHSAHISLTLRSVVDKLEFLNPLEKRSVQHTPCVGTVASSAEGRGDPSSCCYTESAVTSKHCSIDCEGLDISSNIVHDVPALSCPGGCSLGGSENCSSTSNEVHKFMTRLFEMQTSCIKKLNQLEEVVYDIVASHHRILGVLSEVQKNLSSDFHHDDSAEQFEDDHNADSLALLLHRKTDIQKPPLPPITSRRPPGACFAEYSSGSKYKMCCPGDSSNCGVSSGTLPHEPRPPFMQPGG